MNFLRRIPLLVWFILPTMLVLGVGVWYFSKPAVLGEKTDSDKPGAVSTPVAGTVEYDIVGRNHIDQGTTGSGYNSNPPTSGPHWNGPAKNGIYDSPLADEQAIHNLEHGYVWISYRSASADLRSSTSSAGLRSGLTEEEINKLKDIVKGDDWKVILTERDADETKIALASWGRVLKMDEPDYDKVKDFVKTYRNRGPEKTPD